MLGASVCPMRWPSLWGWRRKRFWSVCWIDFRFGIRRRIRPPKRAWKTRRQTFGSNSSFNATCQATHDFIIAGRSTTVWKPLAAVYHGNVPAWAASGNTLVGCILRNTPRRGCEWLGALGSDNDPHTIEYALRVPTGLEKPESGAPLREARNYNTPMQAVIVPVQSGGELPTEYSLLQVQSPSSAAVTVAKPGTADTSALVLRVYQPENTMKTILLQSGDGVDMSNTTGVNAMEDPLSAQDEKALNIKATPTSVQFDAVRALTTLKVSR